MILHVLNISNDLKLIKKFWSNKQSHGQDDLPLHLYKNGKITQFINSHPTHNIQPFFNVLLHNA